MPDNIPSLGPSVPGSDPKVLPNVKIDLRKHQDPSKITISQPERDLFKWLIGNIKDKVTSEDKLKEGIQSELKKLKDTTRDDNLKRVLEREEHLLSELANSKSNFLTNLHRELTGRTLTDEELEETIHTYVLSKNFYAQDLTKMTYFELEVTKFIRGQQLDIIMLMNFAKEYPTWATENKYYFIPILILMLRDYIASMKTQI